MSGVRFSIAPGDVPPIAAARRLGLTLEEFKERLPELRERGFPSPDQTTGHFDLDAIDLWRKRRHPHLFRLTESTPAVDAGAVVRDRLARMRGG